MPPVFVLNHPQAYDVWVIFKALGGRFLPSQILNEPEDLLVDMITLESVYNALQEKANGNKND